MGILFRQGDRVQVVDFEGEDDYGEPEAFYGGYEIGLTGTVIEDFDLNYGDAVLVDFDCGYVGYSVYYDELQRIKMTEAEELFR